MTEFDAPSEHEPRDMTTHLDLYLTNCSNLHSSAGLILALKQLARAELGLNTAEANRLPEVFEAGGILPAHQLYDNSPAEAKEAFGLAPLRFLAPFIETSYTPAEVERWYEKAVHIALELAPGHTNEECLGDGQPDFVPTCGSSNICPRRFLRTVLSEPLTRIVTHDASLAFDPEAYFQLGDIKLALALQHGLVTAGRADMLAQLNRARRVQYEKRPFETE